MGCPIAQRFSKSGFKAAAHDLDRMIKIKRLGCILLLIGIAGLMGYSQEKANEYVSPSEAVPRGKIPKMQIQLLNPGEPAKQYAVIFYQGDEAFSGLSQFADKMPASHANFGGWGRTIDPIESCRERN